MCVQKFKTTISIIRFFNTVKLIFKYSFFIIRIYIVIEKNRNRKKLDKILFLYKNKIYYYLLFNIATIFKKNYINIILKYIECSKKCGNMH